MRNLRPLGNNAPKPKKKTPTPEPKNPKHGIANATGIFKKWGKARPGMGKPPRNVHTKPIFSSTTAKLSSVNKSFFNKPIEKPKDLGQQINSGM